MASQLSVWEGRNEPISGFLKRCNPRTRCSALPHLIQTSQYYLHWSAANMVHGPYMESYEGEHSWSAIARNAVGGNVCQYACDRLHMYCQSHKKRKSLQGAKGCF